MQIIILGMHRSGTSATARLINMAGAYFAPDGMALAAKPDNPKGFWERRDMMFLNDELLKSHGCRWNMLANWRYENAANVPVHLKQHMQRLIAEMDAHRPWFLKDPRLCLTLPAWQPLLKTPVAVIVHRNPLEIAVSLANRNPQPEEYSLALWEYYAVGMLNASQHMPRVFVRHEEILANPVKACEAMVKQLSEAGVSGLSMPSADAIEHFIDPRLYRAKILLSSGPVLSAEQQRLSEMLRGTLAQKQSVQVSQKSLEIMRRGLPETLPAAHH
jgi:hypothetical protein